MIQFRRERWCVRDAQGKLHKFATEAEALALVQGELPVPEVEEVEEEDDGEE